MTPDMFRKLAALGLSNDQMAGVLEIMESEAETRKEKARNRVQKWREKQSDPACNVTKRSVTSPNVTTRLTRVEDITSKLVVTGEEKERTSPSAQSKRGERISSDFQPDIDAAVSEGLSLDEAKRQARSFCDYWKAKPGKDGLKLDWQATWRVWYRRNISTAPRGSPPANGKRDMNDVLNDLVHGKSNHATHSGPTIEGSYERGDWGGPPNLVQLNAVASRFRS